MSGTSQRTQKIGSQFMPQSAIALTLNLTLLAGTGQVVDLTPLVQAGTITNAQAIFVDNAANSAGVSIAAASGQTLIVPPQSQGIFPLLLSNGSPKFTVTGSGSVTLLVLNVPMPFGAWGVGGSPALTVTSGNLQVADTALDSAVSNGAIITAPRAGALTSGSGTSPASPTSTQLFAASTRRYLAVQAPAADDMWVNINGGAAAINGVDCVRVPANTFYEFETFVSQTAIFYYTAAASATFAAFQA